MSERTIADDLVDWLVYAPIGAVVTITEDLPGLVDKGRRRMRVVRFAGNFALKVARYRLDSYLDTLRPREPQQSSDETKKSARELEASAQAEASDERAKSNGAGTATGRRSGSRATGATRAGAGERGRAKGAEALAIPGYDTLAAAQIVKLLPGLSPSELEAVRRHEVAGRSRATILNRIAQLMDGHPPRTARR